MYGPQDRPLTEDMPLTGFGRKPKVRAGITKAWQRAHGDGQVLAVAVRGSDFYGPDVEKSVLSNYGVKRLLQGKPALIPYSPDHPHDFTYVAGLRARACQPARCASGRLWPSLACAERAHGDAAFTAGKAAEKIGVAPALPLCPGRCCIL